MALQHLRSNTASKRPTPASMADGQLAINTNATSPGVFFKDAGGALIKVGPVHVGTSAPNSSPAVGGSTGNAVGEQWLDTSGGGYVFKIWDGSAWRTEAGEFVDVAGDTMTGALILPSGTAAAPALGVGSTDNGVYSPGADQVALATNGTGRLFVDANGDVGVGTASPSTDLHVVGNQTRLLVDSTNASSNVGISFGDNGTTVGGVLYSNTDDALYFQTNGTTERLRITSDGKVGVGTNTTGSNAKFEVKSTTGSINSATLRLNSSDTTTGAVNTGSTILLSGHDGSVSGRDFASIFGAKENSTSGNYASYLAFGTRQNGGAVGERLRITSNGKVGIGTTSPGAALQIDAGSAFSTLRFNNTAGGTAVDLGATSAGDLAIRAGASERLRITSNGKVGIGTTSPGQILSVGSTGGRVFTVNQGTANRTILNNDRALELRSNAGYQLIHNANNSSGSIGFQINSSEKARIDSSGRLGLGTSSPEKQLTIQSPSVATFSLKTTRNLGGGVAAYNFGEIDFTSTDVLSGLTPPVTKARIAATAETASTVPGGALTFYTNNYGVNETQEPIERVRIDGRGNVGIGTTSPAYNLTVEGKGETTQAIDARTNAPNGSLAQLVLLSKNASGTNNFGFIKYDGDDKMEIGTAGSGDSSINIAFTAPTGEAMRIDSSGRVGVGTSSPSGKLDVLGTVNFRRSSSVFSQIDGNTSVDLVYTANASRANVSPSHIFRSSTGGGAITERARIDSSGRLLVGTSSSIDVASTAPAAMQVAHAAGLISGAFYSTANASGPGGVIALGHGRNSTSGLLSSGDVMGQIRFAGADGTDMETVGAQITAEVDGAPGANDMPGRLVFSTTANGASSPTERLRIDSSGRLLVGTSSSRGVGGTAAADLQIEVTGGKRCASFVRNGGSSIVSLGRTGSTGIGDTSLVSNGNVLGAIEFAGADGTDLTSVGAEIKAEVDGTPGVDDMPGRLLFATSGDGQNDPQERMRIDSSGRLGLGTSSPDFNCHIIGTGTDLLKIQRSGAGGGAKFRLVNGDGNYYDLFNDGAEAFNIQYNGTSRLKIDSSGKVGIGTTSPAAELHVKSTTQDADLQVESTFTGGDARLNLYANSGGVSQIRLGDQASANVGTISYLHTDDALAFRVNGSERVRIDSSGRLIVGRTSWTGNSSKLISIGNTGNTSGVGLITVARGQAAGDLSANQELGRHVFTDNGGEEFARIASFVDGTPGASNDNPGRLEFSTTADGAASPTERMRIASNGITYIGDTTITTSSQKTTSPHAIIYTNGSTSLLSAGGLECNTTSNNSRFHISFTNPNGVVGSIRTSGSATAFNTSSDYRLKENVVPLTNAADRVNQLQVHRFNFIADPDTTVDGFLAHEAQVVVPESVTGAKDEVDDEGNPVYQGIDQSKLVPLLTAALQEALAEIESLKARVTAVEP